MPIEDALTEAPGTSVEDDFFDKEMARVMDDKTYAFGSDPDKTSADIKSVLGPGRAPTLAPANDDEVRLPGGLVTPDGVQITAVVRELTGADEEALAKARQSENLVRFTNTLLKAVVSIGDVPATPEVLKGLLVGDREALVLGIRCATFGNTITYEGYLCPECGEKLDITVDLKTLDMKELDDREKREFEVSLRKGIAVVRLPTAGDADTVVEQALATAAEENTILLSRCVLSIDGKPVNGSKETVQGLGIKDRQTILSFLAETQPGPRYDEVKSRHDSCDTEFPLYLAVDDLFRGL